MSAPCVVDEDGLSVLLLHSPILSREALEGLAAALTPPPTSAPLALIVRSAHPRVFLAGAHLAEIAALDAGSSAPYARLGRRVLDLLREYPAPVVAAVHGACLGGGVDLVLSCDAAVAGSEARFGHPGVRRGLVTGWGGTVDWRAAIGRSPSVLALLTGTSVSATEATRLGWVRSVAGDPAAAAAQEARRLAALHPSRLAAWRLLRGRRFVDRFRTLVVHNSRKSRDFSVRESR